MKTLIMCQGLPGSGKTTWALEQVGGGRSIVGLYSNLSTVMRVNKDDIRRELEAGGWTWTPKAEGGVIGIRDARIDEAFWNGATTVISDDTNFGRRHKVELERIARAHGATFEVKRFDTPVAECIRRDTLREGKARVGAAVIQKMAAQYGLAGAGEAVGAPIPVVADPLLPPAIICDLDGTLALFKAKGHRGPFDASRCAEDECNEAVRAVLCQNWASGRKILYVSGRHDTYRRQTEEFLRKRGCPLGTMLLMRAAGDNRKDTITKRELFDVHIRGRFNIQFVLDDRDSVVAMWRALGLQCWQVAEGNF